MDLAQFIDKYRDAIAQRVVESYPPLYRPSQNGRGLPQLLRSPLGAQADAIRGVTLSLAATPGHQRRGGDGHRQDLQCAALRGIGYPAQPGRTRRKFLGQPTHPEAKA